jgi:2-C-methyl-D-erythritol 2,4-cyclodiphosphate synthase
MRANIAEALGVDPERVNVKGSTAEGLGPVGEGLGIECHAVALVVRL